PLERITGWFSSVTQPLFTSLAALLTPASPQEPASGQKEGGEGPEEKGSASPEFALGVDPDLIWQYQNLLQIEPVRNTRLVQVLFSTPDPRLSQELANAHAAAFIRTNLETRFDLSREARDFLESKLVELTKKVIRAEAALNRFRQ